MVAQCRISGRKTIDAKQAHGSAQGGSIDEQREQHVFLLTALITTAFGARAFSLFVLLPPLETLGLTQRIDFNYKLAIIWGGLRGALTLVLALSVTEHGALPPNVERFVTVLATGFEPRRPPHMIASL